MTCCPGMTGLLQIAGERGLAVLACDSRSGPVFLLQGRACRRGDEKLIRGVKSDVPIENITLTESMNLSYCPSCGYSLQKLAREQPAWFAELARLHSSLVDPWEYDY